MRPRNRLKLIRILLVGAILAVTSLAALWGWMMFKLAAPARSQAKSQLTVPSPDPRFSLTVRQVPVGQGRFRLVLNLEDSQGALAGCPLVLPDAWTERRAEFWWSNLVVMSGPRPDAGVVVGWVTNYPGTNGDLINGQAWQ